MTSPIRQARLPLRAETVVRLTATDGIVVGVQNIALARIDLVPADADKPRRVLLNLIGTRDIDRLIEALQVAKSQIEGEQEYLDKYFAEANAKIDAETLS